MNIDDLPAGPELDALVAERVMGWEVKHTSETFGLPGDPLPALYFDPGSGEKCWRENGKRFWQAWSPSEDIAVAWEIVEKSISDGYMAYCGLPSGHGWIAVIGRGKGFGKTAPLAIVRAALNAAEEKT